MPTSTRCWGTDHSKGKGQQGGKGNKGRAGKQGQRGKIEHNPNKYIHSKETP